MLACGTYSGTHCRICRSQHVAAVSSDMHASSAGEALSPQQMGPSSGRAVAKRGRRQYIIVSYCVMACCSSYPSAALAVALRRGAWPESLQPDPLVWRRVQLPVLATSSCAKPVAVGIKLQPGRPRGGCVRSEGRSRRQRQSW